MSSTRLNNEAPQNPHSSSSFDLDLNSVTDSSKMNISDPNVGLYDNYNNTEFSIKINSSEFYPKVSKKNKIINFLNKTRFGLVSWMDSAAPAFLFGQILPPLPAPYHLMMSTVNFAINHHVGNIIETFITRSDPLNSLRIDGKGSAGQGLLKKGIKSINALTTVLFIGGGLSVLIMKDADLRKALEQSISFNHPVVFVPILGTVGLLANHLSLKAWNYCWPAEKESLVNYHVNLLQEFGQYAMSYFNAYTWDTLLNQYLIAAGAEEKIGGPSIVMLRMMSCYVLRESLNYKYHPDPTLSEEKYEIQAFRSEMSQEMEVIEEVKPNHCYGMYRMGMLGGITLILLISSYFINLYAIEEDLYKENNLSDNTKLSLAVLGTVLLAEFIIKSLTPRICRLTFFGKSKKEETYNSLLDMPVIIDSKSETEKRGSLNII